jgi:hypothetical protein
LSFTPGDNRIKTLIRTRVVNVRTAAPGSYVYVGRAMPRHKNPAFRTGSPFGNPFKVGADGTIEEVLAKYRQHVLASQPLRPLLPTLRGKALGCWCCDWQPGQPPGPCHACILAELADGPPLT